MDRCAVCETGVDEKVDRYDVCPRCGVYFHFSHLQQWIATTKYCPSCLSSFPDWFTYSTNEDNQYLPFYLLKVSSRLFSVKGNIITVLLTVVVFGILYMIS